MICSSDCYSVIEKKDTIMFLFLYLLHSSNIYYNFMFAMNSTETVWTHSVMWIRLIILRSSSREILRENKLREHGDV